MKDSELLLRVQVLARERGIPCTWRPNKGKGSHGVLTFGNCRTVLRNPKDELKTGTYHAMLRQLGLTHNEIARRT